MPSGLLYVLQVLHWCPATIPMNTPGGLWSWRNQTTFAVHFYEAVLATLAVVVWHLYSVIFDPDVYPMETAWLTGRSVTRRGLEHLEESPTDSAAEAEGTPNGSSHG